MINTSRLKPYVLSLLFINGLSGVVCSQNALENFFIPSDTLNIHRVWLSSGFCTATYSGFSIGLFKAWYSKSEQTSFHSFNDIKEWNQMDKAAHCFDSYFQTALCYDGARWSGIKNQNALIIGSSVAMLFQTTIEVLDGFSADYGFSFADIGFNLVGTGMFVTQQRAWGEQKFKLKISAYPKNYPEYSVAGQNGTFTTLKTRALQLYGNGYFNNVLKDYNAQTFWLSFNPNLFSEKINSYWPSYLNLALGYGSDNLYGGFKNEWASEDERFVLISENRLRQYYLSLDIDLKKINVKNHFLKTAFSILNIIKIPAPALEINSSGRVKGHWLFF